MRGDRPFLVASPKGKQRVAQSARFMDLTIYRNYNCAQLPQFRRHKSRSIRTLGHSVLGTCAKKRTNLTGTRNCSLPSHHKPRTPCQ